MIILTIRNLSEKKLQHRKQTELPGPEVLLSPGEGTDHKEAQRKLRVAVWKCCISRILVVNTYTCQKTLMNRIPKIVD